MRHDYGGLLAHTMKKRGVDMKIGLLAMSGVRVCDTELLELGLTLPAFVDRGKVIASLPSLSLLYLAAVTPKEHEVYYFDSLPDGTEPSELYSCDLVAISTFSAQAFEAYEAADRLRAAGVIVAMGGLHVSVVPDEAIKHADHVVIGEGELVWPHVIDAVIKGRKGIVWDAKNFPAVDVASLPIPRYDLLNHTKYNRFTVQTARGCPWRCEFCASSVMLGLPYRRRPISNIIRDIEAILDHTSRPFIEFADDNTFVHKKWGIELCKSIEPYHLKWFTETDISIADSPELLSAMRSSGCRQVLIGLESPIESGLDGLEARNNFKKRRFEKYRAAIRTIQDHGITVNGCFILGLDDHGPEIFQHVYDFVKETSLYEVQITVLTPFPGTPLYRRFEREGRLLFPGEWNRCTLFDINYTPMRMSPSQLRDGFLWLTKELYSSDFVAYRRRTFFERLRSRPVIREESSYGLELQH